MPKHPQAETPAPTPPIQIVEERRTLVTVVSGSVEEKVPGLKDYSSFTHRAFVSQEFPVDADFDAAVATVCEKTVAVLDALKAKHREQFTHPTNA